MSVIHRRRGEHLSYKDKTYYNYLETLTYSEGRFYDNGVKYKDIKDMLETAYNDGKSDGSQYDEYKDVKVLLTVIVVILIMATEALLLYIIML